MVDDPGRAEALSGARPSSELRCWQDRIAEGRSNSQVGKDLVISTKRASVHVSIIIAKLGLSSRGEAAAWAHAQRVIA